MPGQVLEYFREKEPKFKDVDDHDLTLFILDKYPQFLQDEQFKNQAESVDAWRRGEPGGRGEPLTQVVEGERVEEPVAAGMEWAEKPNQYLFDPDQIGDPKVWKQTGQVPLALRDPRDVTRSAEITKLYEPGASADALEYFADVDWDATSKARREPDPTKQIGRDVYLTKQGVEAEEQARADGLFQMIDREKKKALEEGGSGWAYLVERMPFIGAGKKMQDFALLYDSAQRLESGDYESGLMPGAPPMARFEREAEDVKRVGKFLAQMESEEAKGFWRKTTDIATAIPGFASEFVLTSGTYSLGKESAEQAVKKLVKSKLSKQTRALVEKGIKRKMRDKLVGSIALRGGKITGFVAGGATQAVAMPHMVAENFFEILAQDKLAITQDEKGELQAAFSEDDPSFLRALYEGYARTAVETISERTGLYATKLFGKTVGKVPGKLADAKFKSGRAMVPGLKAVLARRWLKAKPGRTTGDLLDKLKEKAAWNGVIGEVFEERVAEVGRAALTRDEWVGWDRSAGDWFEQLASESLAFAVPGGARKHIIEPLIEKDHLSQAMRERTDVAATAYSLPAERGGEFIADVAAQEQVYAEMREEEARGPQVDVPKPGVEIDTKMDFEVEEEPAVEFGAVKGKKYEVAEYPAGKEKFGIRKQTKKGKTVYRAVKREGKDNWTGFPGRGQGEYATREEAEDALVHRVKYYWANEDFRPGGKMEKFGTPRMRQQIIGWQKGLYDEDIQSEEEVRNIKRKDMAARLGGPWEDYGKSVRSLQHQALIDQYNVGRKMRGLDPLPKKAAEAPVEAEEAPVESEQAWPEGQDKSEDFEPHVWEDWQGERRQDRNEEYLENIAENEKHAHAVKALEIDRARNEPLSEHDDSADVEEQLSDEQLETLEEKTGLVAIQPEAGGGFGFYFTKPHPGKRLGQRASRVEKAFQGGVYWFEESATQEAELVAYKAYLDRAGILGEHEAAAARERMEASEKKAAPKKKAKKVKAADRKALEAMAKTYWGEVVAGDREGSDEAMRHFNKRVKESGYEGRAGDFRDDNEISKIWYKHAPAHQKPAALIAKLKGLKEEQAAKKKAVKPKDEVKKTPPVKKKAAAKENLEEAVKAVLQDGALTEAEIVKALKKRGITKAHGANTKDVYVHLYNNKHRFTNSEDWDYYKREKTRYGLKSAPRKKAAVKPKEEVKKAPAKRQSLVVAMQEVLKGKQMDSNQIMEAMKKRGYKFTGRNPMNSLRVALYTNKSKFNNNKGVFSLKRAPRKKAAVKPKEEVKKTPPKKKAAVKKKAAPKKKAATRKKAAPKLKPIPKLAKSKPVPRVPRPGQVLDATVKALKPIASTNKEREVITVINSTEDGKVWASDGEMLVEVEHPGATKGASWKVEKGKVSRVKQGNVPKVENVKPPTGPRIASFDTGEMVDLLNRVLAMHKKVANATLHLYSGPKGWSVRTKVDGVEYAEGKEGKFIVSINAGKMQKMVTAARKTGVGTINLHAAKRRPKDRVGGPASLSPAIFKGMIEATEGNFDREFSGVLMPMRPGSEVGAAKEKSPDLDDVEEGGAVLASYEKATLPRKITAPHHKTGEPVSLQEIREYISKALDIPIRKGVGRMRVHGFYRPDLENIRMKWLNNVPTISHEVGHYLHYLIFPQEKERVKGDPYAGGRSASTFNEKFDDELLALGKRTSRKSYTKAQKRMEGVAEFTRLYMTNRDEAHRKAPEFFRFFRDHLYLYPQINKALDKVYDMVQKYTNQPGFNQVSSMIAGVDERPGEKGGVKLWLRDMYDEWVNELAPLERAVQQLKAYGLDVEDDKMADQLAIAYMGGWRGRVEHSIWHNQIDADGNEVGPSLKQVLSGVENLHEFQVYLVARRALEKMKQGKETGFTQESTQEVVTTYGDRYEEVSERLDNFMTNELKMLQQAGFISQEEFDAIKKKNQDYVPFHRMYERVGGGGRGGRGFVDLSKGGLKGFHGDDLRIYPPLESIIKNMYLTRDMIERQRIGKAFVDNFIKTPGGGRIGDPVVRNIKPIKIDKDEVKRKLKKLGLVYEGVDGHLYQVGTDEPIKENSLSFKIWRATQTDSAEKGIFSIWRNGKQEFYQIDDPALYASLKLQDSTAAEVLSRMPYVKVAGKFTRTLRAGATLTLEFIARNPFRDQVQAAVYSQYGYIPFFDGFRGMLSALKKDKHYWSWVKASGRYADFLALDRTDLTKTLDDVVPPGWKHHVKKWANPLQTLRRVSELMEMATRLQEYKLAIARGASPTEAANASKTITLNYARFGFRGKAVNQLTAFFNAKAQDWDKFGREHAGTGRLGVMAKGIQWITVPSLLIWYLGKDDDEINGLAPWRKIGMWNINMRWAAEAAGIDTEARDAEGNLENVPIWGDWVFSFPKPFLLGYLYGSAPEAALDWVYKDDPKAITDFFKELSKESPLPLNLDPEQYFFQVGLAPTVTKPVIEALGNINIHTGAPLENEAQLQYERWLRSNGKTTEVMQYLAEQGMIYTDGALNVSPIVLDNFVRSYTGGLGTYGMDFVDALMLWSSLVDTPPQPAMTWKELPGIKAFVKGRYEPHDALRQFHEGMQLVEQRQETFRRINMTRKPDNWYVKRYGERVSHYRRTGPIDPSRSLDDAVSGLDRLRRAQDNLSTIRRNMEQVRDDREMSREQKSADLFKLYRERDDVAKDALQWFHPEDLRDVKR